MNGSTLPFPKVLRAFGGVDLWSPGIGALALAVVGICRWLHLAPVPTIVDVVVLPLVMAAFVERVATLVTEREQAFWIRLACGLLFLWLAALFELLLFYGASPVLAPGLDALRLLAFLPVALALDLRSHRHEIEAPRLLRQLQLTAVFLLVLMGAFYFELAPRWVLEHRRLEGGEMVAADIAFALLFGIAAARRTSVRWRLLFALGAAVFVMRAVSTALPDAALPTVAAVFLTTCWARARHLEIGGASLDPPAPRWLRLELPVVALLPVLPSLHLGFAALDFAQGPAEPARSWLVLASLAVLTPMATIEYLWLKRRSSFLELEHRRAAAETVERSVYLDKLIEHSPLAIVVLDPDQRVRMINPAFEGLFDYRSHEVVGSTLDRLISTDTRRSEASGYTRAVTEGRSVHVTTRRRKRDGTELDVELYGVPLVRDDELIGLFAIYQDVTDRVRTETALRESEDRFRRLSDASFEGIVVAEEEVIVDCNEQYARLLGLETHEVIGRPMLDFVAPEDRRLVASRLERGQEQPFEHRVAHANGAKLVVEVRGRSVRYEGRQVRVSAVRDVTESKRFEEEVRQAQKMEAVGRLAGGIAHDFNNLLTVIKGYAQLAAMQMQPGNLKKLVEEILQASERASLMTKRLLAFGRKQAVMPQNLDLNLVISGMEKILRRLIRADIAFDLKFTEGLGQIKADASQIEQVILNLVINAGDAMPKGGTLRLHTSVVEIEEGHGEGPMAAAGSYVRLQVGDTGSGMDAATLSQVFEPFFTTKAKGKGTGLGLATVYAIVRQCGGTIDVESELGDGTTFSVYFPRVPDTGDCPSSREAVPPLPKGDETVLVVEDEPGVRALAVEFLQSQGYRVLEAADGRDGLRLFEQHGAALDLVLTDVVMPEMNGPEMVRVLLDRRSDLRVLYMSGYTDQVLGTEDPQFAHLLVQKPFSIEELVLKVREILDGKAG